MFGDAVTRVATNGALRIVLISALRQWEQIRVGLALVVVSRRDVVGGVREPSVDLALVDCLVEPDPGL